MSNNAADRPTQFSPPQQISGLLNHPTTTQDHNHIYPDPLQLQAGSQPSPPTLHQHQLSSQSSQQHADSRDATPLEAKGRLRKACDSCSVRKVKCDESGPPCRSCAVLDIPCTFERPSKRRGPPNRHAEAIKRQRLEQQQEVSSTLTGQTSDDDRSTSTGPRLSAESICPLPTLQKLIDDYFTYIHPLVPLPHEPTFRMQLHRRDDMTDMSFLALIANMIAALVASFPRRPRQLLASEEMQRRFPSAGALIKVCQRVSAEARGPAYLSGKLTILDSLNSYLTALTYAYTFEFRRARLYFGESLLILRNMNLHRAPENRPTTTFEVKWTFGSKPADDVDYVNQELGRRLFWVNYASNSHMRQLGSIESDILIPALSNAEMPPPLPIEVDDPWISATQISEPPPGLVSEITGFNANILVMRACNPLVAAETSADFDPFTDNERHKRTIAQCLQKVKHATDSLPPELLLNPTGQHSWPSLEDPRGHSRRVDPWAEDGPRGRTPHLQYSRQKVLYEIQKANIYATQLATRSYLVEKYWDLCEIGINQKKNLMQDPTLETGQADEVNRSLSDMDQREMTQERDDILRDLSVLLSSISQVNMEPNGTSITNKIRFIASTLLKKVNSTVVTSSTLDHDSMQNYLKGFIEIMMKLERLGPGLADASSPASGDSGVWGQSNIGLTAEEIEERELVQWASLKEHQEKFARDLGFVRSL